MSLENPTTQSYEKELLISDLTLSQSKTSFNENILLDQIKTSEETFSSILLEREPESPPKTGKPNQKYPILFVDINLGHNKIERITIFEGDDPSLIGKDLRLQNT